MVVGDLLLDQYVWGEVSRISPEAPVPVVWVKREDYMPGGASNVANNIAKLGAEVMLVGVVGEDVRGELLKYKLEERNINVEGVFVDKERQTSLKTRVIAHTQQVVRIDREDVDVMPGAIQKRMKDYINENIKKVDGIVIEDYGKGVITPELLKFIVPLARRHKKVVSVDPKESHFPYYRGVTVITPNHHEAGRAVGFTLKDDDDVKKAGRILMNKLKLDSILITLGEKGMMLFEKDIKPQKIPTLAQEVFDVCGAGDTVIGVYTLAIASKASAMVAAQVANCAAGIVVGKVGVAVVSRGELLQRLKTETRGYER
jgi:D-beta-D-heptose 7-phosphate kinase/D-beta-D-heptose 1-phosphate adenosyltransferase